MEETKTLEKVTMTMKYDDSYDSFYDKIMEGLVTTSKLIPLPFDGLERNVFGDVILSDRDKFINDLKDKDDPILEEKFLDDLFYHMSFLYPIIKKIILETREELDENNPTEVLE